MSDLEWSEYELEMKLGQDEHLPGTRHPGCDFEV